MLIHEIYELFRQLKINEKRPVLADLRNQAYFHFMPSRLWQTEGALVRWL